MWLRTLLAVTLSGALLAAQRGSAPPPSGGAVPSPRQLAWHELEFYGFIHFTVNTFTDREWGYGDEPESIFNPTALDVTQWVSVARDAGMKGLILTAKHHDGFTLWPSRYTDHSVKRSPWRGGEGDVVGELARACAAAGLKFGVYLSPWDRNHADYGRPRYLTYYRSQLRELLTQYGPLFEVWFDGANGGDGFYGGARERRRIDGATYYDWANTWNVVRSLQPDAVMFSDAGPDVRWVGNERGVAFETSWNPINLAGLYPGHPDYTKVAAGRPDGTDWVPPEVDVSIRPGWFYHPAEDDKVKTVAKLVEIYEQSVGRGANLLLNIPPDRRGLIPEIDAARLREFGRVVANTYRTDLAASATVRASDTCSGGAGFTATRVLEWPAPIRAGRIVLQEVIALGQRVEGWSVHADAGGGWKAIAQGTTIGRKRIAHFEPLTTSRIKIDITQARACPALAPVGVFGS